MLSLCFVTPFVPFFSPHIFFFPFHFCPSFYPLPNTSPLFPCVFCDLSCPCLDPVAPSCLTKNFYLPSLLFSSLQRCRCHLCFVSPRSESYQFRSGNSTRRVLSWWLSTRLSIPVALVMHTSNASSTAPCWSERHQGTQTKHTLVFSISAAFLE